LAGKVLGRVVLLGSANPAVTKLFSHLPKIQAPAPSASQSDNGNDHVGNARSAKPANYGEEHRIFVLVSNC